MARRALSSFLPLNSCKGAVVQIHSFLPNSNPFILVQLKSIHFSPVQIHSFQSSSNPFISAQFKSTHFSPVQSIHFSPVQIHSFQSCSNPFISVQFKSIHFGPVQIFFTCSWAVDRTYKSKISQSSSTWWLRAHVRPYDPHPPPPYVYMTCGWMYFCQTAVSITVVLETKSVTLG